MKPAGAESFYVVAERDQARPERRHRAGAADHALLAVDARAIAAGGAGVAGDIGHAVPLCLPGFAEAGTPAPA